jgi:microcystin-dependent protein
VQCFNTGLIIPWTTASVPSGFLECNGAAVSEVTYAALFAVIGYTYGNPGSGNFNLPDLTDRIVVHKSPTKSLATTGGANTVAGNAQISAITVGNTTLTAPEIAAHTHSQPIGCTANMIGARNDVPNLTSFSSDYPSGPPSPKSTASAGGSGAHTHTANAANFAGGTNSVLQPYLTLKYIIKT